VRAGPLGLATLAWLAAWPLAPVSAQTTAVVSVEPPSLDLSAGPGDVEITLSGAPPLGRFQLDLVFDPSVAVPTGLSGPVPAGGVTLVPRLTEPGRLHLESTLPAGATPAVLAVVTFHPLDRGGVDLQLAGVELFDPQGATVPSTVRSGRLDVRVAPAAPQQTEAAERAATLVTAPLEALTPEAAPGPEDAADDPDQRWLAGWVGLLALSLLVVLVGWLVGREPAEEPFG
jgi:hypothetical protein